MKPFFISFYTPDYADEARELERTLWQWELEYVIRPAESRGTWVRNCGYKPRFIREMMLDYPDRPVVWLDADARVRQYPVLFDSMDYSMDCDFAAHWRHGSELLSGTLYFGPTENARKLASIWCVEQSWSDDWDQRVLQKVIERGDVPGLKVERLPSTYTRVFDDLKMGEPVIEHLQASRRLAKVV